jgi:hypothetical protein
MSGLQIQVHPNMKAMFAMAVFTIVGNGVSTKFWMDCWLWDLFFSSKNAGDLHIFELRREKGRTLKVQNTRPPNPSWSHELHTRLWTT